MDENVHKCLAAIGRSQITHKRFLGKLYEYTLAKAIPKARLCAIDRFWDID
jgi:hypothetical protein